MCVVVLFVFFFKQKTAYEMRISDWSSDVCSSDLLDAAAGRAAVGACCQGFWLSVTSTTSDPIPRWGRVGMRAIGCGEFRFRVVSLRRVVAPLGDELRRPTRLCAVRPCRRSVRPGSAAGLSGIRQERKGVVE